MKKLIAAAALLAVLAVVYRVMTTEVPTGTEL